MLACPFCETCQLLVHSKLKVHDLFLFGCWEHHFILCHWKWFSVISTFTETIRKINNSYCGEGWFG
jgi:hypothetical protein